MVENYSYSHGSKYIFDIMNNSTTLLIVSPIHNKWFKGKDEGLQLILPGKIAVSHKEKGFSG